jgi:hypothetical protein
MNLEALAIAALALAAIPALLFLWNAPQLRRLRGWRPAGNVSPAAISVLIPARNEAANIRGALTAALANRDAGFEVVVLDDHSEDGTADIVREFMAEDARVRLETAPPLPPGWCGKQHACHVLAQRARHPLLLFVDADVRLAPDALARLSTFMTRGDGAPPPALASGVPRQLTGTFLEKLLIPLIHFVLLGFLPLWRMRRCTKPAYGAGCGQLFIARADAYHAAGGHAAIRDSLHDGVTLPRAFRRAGFRTDLFDATDLATCRMYHSGGETIAGLMKNAHEGLAAPALIGPWTLLLFGGHVLPWLLLAAAPWWTATTVKWAALAAVISLLPRLLAAWRFQQSWLGALLHPLGVLLFLGVQWRAFFRRLGGQTPTWKGRSYPAAPAPERPETKSKLAALPAKLG